MPLLNLPDVPKRILASEFNSQESQIISEGNYTYFIDRYEYPEKGGMLVYKYGGTIAQFQVVPSKYEESGRECLKELKDLLKRYDFDLTGQDRQPVMLIPNEIIRLENSQEIKNRVDLKYPEKGFPDPLAISLANKVKRVLKEEVAFFSYKWTLIAFSTFILLPFKYKIKIIEKWLDGWSGYAVLTTDPRRMKPQYYKDFCRELLKFVDTFLKALGISEIVSERTAWIMAELAERDNAYQWRGEDLASEMSVDELIKNPRKEIMRIVEILKQREQKSQKLIKTVESFAKILCLVLYLSRFRKAWEKALQSTDFKNFQFDDIDRHQVMQFDGYNFFGIPCEARKQAWINLYGGNPPQMVHIQ